MIASSPPPITSHLTPPLLAQVSVYVDTVSSAIGPSISETRATGRQPTNGFGSVKNKRRTNGTGISNASVTGDRAGSRFASDTRHQRSLDGSSGNRTNNNTNSGKSEQARPFPGRRRRRRHGSIVGVGQGAPADFEAFGETRPDEGIGSEDEFSGGGGRSSWAGGEEQEEVALAKARRKLLDPPKVGLLPCDVFYAVRNIIGP